MSAKKFNTPFAILGDKVEIPTTAQIDGSVSFQQGYPFGYEAEYTDPNSKDISRSKTNQLLFDITNAIREIQQGGVSEWSKEGKPYKINSLVYAPDGTIKQSLIANNNNDTTHSSWSNLINVSTLANLDTQYVKLTGNQTVEGIKTFSSSPIVPTPTAETHAANKAYVDGLSSNGLGVGQTWLNVTSSRTAGVTYTNTTGKPIYVYIVVRDAGGQGYTVTINGISIDYVNMTGAFDIPHSFIIPAGATYRVIPNSNTISKWLELR